MCLSLSLKATETGTGGNRRRAGQKQRVTTETSAEEEACWWEEGPAHQRLIWGQWGEWKRATECLQFNPGGGSCQKPETDQSPA